ncbi:hypothetical protein ACUY3K_11075 [Corynebacterium uberis]|uniref:hypothetical protein n=1 Tax=Corynebacterium TaxID=1716 RepID=UPI001D0B9518|nr:MULTISPECIES: hypothetical protein [Corynebacterium]MCZ9309738.1 hypothetical protein [Corynebacterium sp. c6VSa_13]UDL73542.1 hypothetical protein LH391_10765 [Corynebacterium uberis]UDL75578.1 hypothetical protein LH393_10160 [Corynebacterium uberis]UDL77791.1 hypothetical protein LH394_10145 [Corynebacterium uberis]UDL80074.1 hypothetical protein LH392_10565 [Corynebacterium uberis]
MSMPAFALPALSATQRHRLASATAVVAWYCTRVLLVLFALRHPTTRTDVFYFYGGVRREQAGQADAMREYPDLTVWIPRLLHHLVGDNKDQFVVAFAVAILTLDAILCWMLARRRAWVALGFWLAFSLVLGPLFIRRLDLLPGLLVAVAALWVGSASPAASALVGLAACAKLWPVALVAGLVGHWRAGGTWLRLAWAGLAIVAVSTITAMTRGWARVVSPLVYQQERGLHVEAVPATPLLWFHAKDPQRWPIDFAESKCFEIFGPHVSTLLAVSTWASVAVAAGVLVVVGVRFVRTGGRDPLVTRVLWLTTVLGIMVTAKVLSPQYMLWLGPLVAAVVACDLKTRTAAGQVVWRWQPAVIAVCVLGAAYATTQIFPLHYAGMVSNSHRDDIAYVIAACRNGLLLVAFGVSVAWLVSAFRAETRRALAASHGGPKE